VRTIEEYVRQEGDAVSSRTIQRHGVILREEMLFGLGHSKARDHFHNGDLCAGGPFEKTVIDFESITQPRNEQIWSKKVTYVLLTRAAPLGSPA
jgi:hypothetical protein